jgi:hypothetical protein
MKNFIFITSNGYTESPQNDHIENCQVLGWSTGETVDDAFMKLLKLNTWILEMGYDDVVGYELANLLPKKTFSAQSINLSESEN